jgi:predicted MFS family arabinose efflux permease
VIPLTAAVTGWRYAFLALAAGPMTALPALAALSRQIRPNGLPSTLTERTLS